jgi:hypothetical protein
MEKFGAIIESKNIKEIDSPEAIFYMVNFSNKL